MQILAALLLRSYPLGSALHQAQSEVQAAAVLSVLRSQGNQLTADEKARLSSMIAASAFAEKDALAIASRCACTRTQRLMMLMTLMVDGHHHLCIREDFAEGELLQITLFCIQRTY